MTDSETKELKSEQKTDPLGPWKEKIRSKHVLLTGGAGYIGSHIGVELIEAGAKVTIFDNLCNSSAEAIKRIKQISGTEPAFTKVDLCDEKALEAAFKSAGKFDAVIHLAGLKAVGESVREPLRYYENNIVATTNLLKLMEKTGCHDLVFSSSATVYGDPKSVPVTEDFETHPTNPYGHTKHMIEIILKDVAHSNKKWRFSILRYFNPIGAHPSGLIGEDPTGIPNNLVPFVSQVAIGTRSHLQVFGSDYKTKDGTGVRDYLHVVDLARGHLAALADGIWGDAKTNCEVYNLGTGGGYSVFDILHAMEKACGKKLEYKVVDRRPGDVAVVYANPKKAKDELHWVATKTLQEAIDDAWKWQSKNPKGFRE